MQRWLGSQRHGGVRVTEQVMSLVTVVTGRCRPEQTPTPGQRVQQFLPQVHMESAKRRVLLH